MLAPNVIGILFGLASALSWGSGDFSGGLATRRAHQFQVMAIASGAGVAPLIVLALAGGEPLPSAGSLMWATAAGLSGALGIGALYRGLASGRAAIVAPMSGMLGAALPVVFGIFTEGLPDLPRLAGFALAAASIWLVSQSPAASGEAAIPARSLTLGALAGLGFGGFFIFIGLGGQTQVFGPLAMSRFASLCVALALMQARNMPLPSLQANPIALLAGLLDTGGNLFFLLARQHTRLDVSVVLSSLYPAATVALARLLLKEDVTRVQFAGLAVSVAAIGLIAA